MLNVNNIDKYYDVYNNVGVVTGIIDGIVTIRGLLNVSFGERIEFIVNSKEEPIIGMVLNIGKKRIYAVVLDDDSLIKPGQKVLRTTTLISVPTGEAPLSRKVRNIRKRDKRC